MPHFDTKRKVLKEFQNLMAGSEIKQEYRASGYPEAAFVKHLALVAYQELELEVFNKEYPSYVGYVRELVESASILRTPEGRLYLPGTTVVPVSAVPVAKVETPPQKVPQKASVPMSAPPLKPKSETPRRAAVSGLVPKEKVGKTTSTKTPASQPAAKKEIAVPHKKSISAEGARPLLRDRLPREASLPKPEHRLVPPPEPEHHDSPQQSNKPKPPARVMPVTTGATVAPKKTHSTSIFGALILSLVVFGAGTGIGYLMRVMGY